MTQKTTKNGVIDDDTIRISFILNVKHNPDLAYLMSLEGHGDRPRELVRLAAVGARNEAQMREITEQVRANEIRKVASKVVTQDRRAAQAAGAASESEDPVKSEAPSHQSQPDAATEPAVQEPKQAEASASSSEQPSSSAQAAGARPRKPAFLA